MMTHISKEICQKSAHTPWMFELGVKGWWWWQPSLWDLWKSH